MAKRGEKRERRSMVWEPDAPGIDMGAGCITPDSPSSESIRPVLRQKRLRWPADLSFHFGGSTANTRTGPPDPPASLIGAATKYAPHSGNDSVFARFSTL